ncbi:MAG: ATP-binding protein [Anaerolineae bacterium]
MATGVIVHGKARQWRATIVVRVTFGLLAIGMLMSSASLLHLYTHLRQSEESGLLDAARTEAAALVPRLSQEPPQASGWITASTLSLESPVTSRAGTEVILATLQGDRPRAWIYAGEYGWVSRAVTPDLSLALSAAESGEPGVAWGSDRVSAYAPVGTSGWSVIALGNPRALALDLRSHLATELSTLVVIVGLSGLALLFYLRRSAEGMVVFADELERQVRQRTANLQSELAERKRLEEQFLQAQKMETVGRLAGGVAHDFNNLLTAISGYGTFVRESLPAGSPARDDMDELLKASGRAADLTSQLLAFSRQQVMAPKIADLNELVRDIEKMLRRLIGEDIELESRLAKGLWRTKADPGKLEQVIMNLVVNARDAMPHGGRLTISTANVTLPDSRGPTELAHLVGQYVVLAVSDTGTGMSEDVRSHVFEPFFTTKEMGKGTGLGLATVYGITKQHGGEVSVESQPGRGTTFTIYLPRTLVEPGPADQATTGDGLPRGTETLLLVEDDAAVRNLTSRLLTGLGYQVVESGDGEEALRVAAKMPAGPQLLVSDLVMPRMGGAELAQRLTALHPSLRVLFVSGYADGEMARQVVPGEPNTILPKPFTTAALAHKVREAMA